MRVGVHVYPGAPRTAVGGRYGDAEPPAVVVRVRERAVDGKANDAVLTAVADAFGVARRDVALVGGFRSRNKLLEVTGADPARLVALLAQLP